MDLFCLDIVNNLYYWKQDKTSGRSRVGGRGGRAPPYLDQTEGPKKILCETAPPPPYLKVWICHWGYKLLLLIDCYEQVTCGEWVKQRRRPLSSSLHSSFTLISSAKSFPRSGGGWGGGTLTWKGWGCLSSHLGSSGQNAIIFSCNRWATPRLVSFRGVIQNFQWASPPISYGSPPPRDLSKIGLLLGYPLNWVVSFLQLVIWMGPGHWCPKPRKFGET